MTGKRIRAVGQDELELWAEVLDGVEPMPGRSRPERKQKAETPRKETPVRPPPKAPVRRPPPVGGIPERDRRRLGRAGVSVAAKFDLHGYGHEAGRLALMAFLRRARERGAATVLVVTGKSERGGRKTSFRREVPMWLALPEFAELVSAFDAAHARHGGEGALYIRIRRRKNPF